MEMINDLSKMSLLDAIMKWARIFATDEQFIESLA